jgi:putative spermidine/putrescine transport system permease protein
MTAMTASQPHARLRPLMDPVVILVAPAAAVMLAFFVYPFVYGLLLSFQPAQGGVFQNYIHFFETGDMWRTIGNTMKLALPATLINVAFALAIAYVTRIKGPYQRLVSTLLVIPLTLGTVLIAEGMLTYFGPQGWLAQTLRWLHIYEGSIRLTHNYWGVLISLIITGFPFAYLLILSYITGIDPALPRAAATLAFSVFPSAVLLGSPAGVTRVIAIAAYEAAFEQYDYSLASAIAMVMGLAQLAIVVAALGLRSMFYRGPVAGGKG